TRSKDPKALTNGRNAFQRDLIGGAAFTLTGFIVISRVAEFVTSSRSQKEGVDSTLRFREAANVSHETTYKCRSIRKRRNGDVRVRSRRRCCLCAGRAQSARSIRRLGCIYSQPGG